MCASTSIAFVIILSFNHCIPELIDQLFGKNTTMNEGMNV